MDNGVSPYRSWPCLERDGNLNVEVVKEQEDGEGEGAGGVYDCDACVHAVHLHS